MKCRFVLPEQISGARYSAVPGLPLTPCSISLPPTGELGWGKGLGPARPQVWYITLFHELCSFLQVCAVWHGPLSCCSLRISCTNYNFEVYAVLGGSLCLTSHTTIFFSILTNFCLAVIQLLKKGC